MFARLDQASARTGMPVNSIVIAACLEWMQRHTPEQVPATETFAVPGFVASPGRPRWSTLRRAVVQAVGGPRSAPFYPFERFTDKAQSLLTAAQDEATKSGNNYIGTEHLLLAVFADPASHAALILANIDVKENDVRAATERALRGKIPPGVQRIIPTSRVKRVIEIAFGLCGTAGDPRVSTGHVLLALAVEGQGIAAHVMKDFDATSNRVRTELEKISDPEP